MAGVVSSTTLTPPGKREYGHWSEVVSSAGKVYYYNRVTEKSQWVKPDGWEKAENIIFPVMDRMQSEREESSSRDNVQTDCALSDDDMDVSCGDSPIDLSSASSPELSTDGSPQTSIENVDDVQEEKIIEDPGEAYTPTCKYYREDLVAPLHEIFHAECLNSHNLALRSALSFEFEFASQETQMYRARAIARTAMAKAIESQEEVETLRNIQQHLEESRLYFQANFESEMRRILKGPNSEVQEEITNEDMTASQEDFEEDSNDEFVFSP